MTAAIDRRRLEAAIARQLAITWAAGAASAQQPPPADALDITVRFAARQHVIDECARAILRAALTRPGQATAERTGRTT